MKIVVRLACFLGFLAGCWLFFHYIRQLQPPYEPALLVKLGALLVFNTACLAGAFWTKVRDNRAYYAKKAAEAKSRRTAATASHLENLLVDDTESE